MPKTNLSSRIKIAFLNIMQALGSAASHMASSAKLRVAEINLQSRRHEILSEFSLQAFEMWHNGVKLPEELSSLFVELSEIDDKLSILRAQKYAKVKVEPEEALEQCEAASPAEAEPRELPAEPAAEEAAAPEPAPKSETAAAPQRAKKAPSAARQKAKPKAKS